MLQQLMEEVQTQANRPENMALLIERLLLVRITKNPSADKEVNEWIRHRWDDPTLIDFRARIVRYVLAKRVHEMNRKGVMVKGLKRSCTSEYEVAVAREDYRELEHWMIDTAYCSREFLINLKRYLGWQLQGVLWSMQVGGSIFTVKPPVDVVAVSSGILQ